MVLLTKAGSRPTGFTHLLKHIHMGGKRVEMLSAAMIKVRWNAFRYYRTGHNKGSRDIFLAEADLSAALFISSSSSTSRWWLSWWWHEHKEAFKWNSKHHTCTFTKFFNCRRRKTESRCSCWYALQLIESMIKKCRGIEEEAKKRKSGVGTSM
jgi:hypothetical protein